MGKKAAKVTTITINSVTLQSFTTSWSQQVKQETPVVTALSDAGPRRVVGNYDHSLDLSGAADFASGAEDATIFALLGSAGVASTVAPTGAAPAANDPNYTSTLVLEEYSISGKVGGGVDWSAKLAGGAALVRAVA